MLVILKMNYYDIDTGDEYMLSPVCKKDGKRFDTRMDKKNILQNTAAVRAIFTWH